MSKILLYDSYDSFTFNLKHYLEEAGASVVVVRNDEMTIDEIIRMAPDGLLLSPGPGVPSESGNLMQVLKYFSTRIPILGVCLGHQALGELFGSNLIKAIKPMHGKVSLIHVQTDELFTGCPSSFEVCRYHSLILEQHNNPFIRVIAETDQGEIMAIRHSSLPLWGVQYHPEAILSQHGHLILRNWLKVVTLRGH